MPSTLETLPNEILLIIFGYCGDVYNIFRTYYGLNQRLNRILVDKRSHLLANFLSIHKHDPILIDYYKSDVFHNISDQLRLTTNEKEVHHCFQSLVTFHIKQEFMKLENEVQLRLSTFQNMRQQPSNIDIDNQLRNAFFDLRDNVITKEMINHIESLVLTKAARLRCDNDALIQNFNLTKALNQLLLCHLNNIHSLKKPLIQPITQMLKTLIISNPHLLLNQDHTEIEESASMWHFLFYSIYQLQYWFYTPPDASINMKCYQAVIHLLLFAIQYQKHVKINQNWAEESLFDILNILSSDQVIVQSGLFIEGVQWEILKMIVNENILITKSSWPENTFRDILNNLLKRNRLDVILLLYQQLEYVRNYFDNPSNIHQNVNILTGSSIGRQLFNILIDEKSLKTWFTTREFIFLLLQKKERKLLEKIFQASPSLINQVDENGNDSLLFICLKVRGCRHRIIQFLINQGSDLQRRNANGENFIDAIKLSKNRSLLKDLSNHEIVRIDQSSGDLKDVYILMNPATVSERMFYE